ncbi:hypothetical protein E0485_06430 [Paenibacillus albiflavus]|uniref:Transcriptional regulator HTH-type FeoC domain-containing protein n=1 Tax=Paenibacillus albiflavus TaxID=2545760 RepID=A0A4R4EGI5_9BACL|nr:hypothetical protein [Paenibacillus albiflavus]TCZ78717.1 hypothetical protein E0485_06430 [Paenibacillus albiflavus]
MIRQILDYLHQGNDFSNKAIQRSLGISEFMAENYKNQLIKGGYINKVDDTACETKKCSSKLCGGCSSSDIGLIHWELTDKGKKALLAR